MDLQILPTEYELVVLGIYRAFFESSPQQIFKNEMVAEGIHYASDIDRADSNLYLAEKLKDELQGLLPMYLLEMKNICPYYSEMDLLEYKDYLISVRDLCVLAHRSNLCNLLFSEN